MYMIRTQVIADRDRNTTEETNMKNAKQIPLMIVGLIAALLLTAVPTSAQTRTTPVEVMNKPFVGIDSASNVIQAVQKDPWYMNILGIPDFNIANSPTVKIDGTTNTVKATQSGTWNVGFVGTPGVNIANTPSVSVASMPAVSISNSPTVKIDATANHVVAASKHNQIQLWTTDQSIANHTYLYSASIDCSGYNEIRVLLWSSVISAEMTVYMTFRSPTGSYMTAKSTTWAGSGSILAITCPVYGDICRLQIYNGTTIDGTIYRHSYAYLVN